MAGAPTFGRDAEIPKRSDDPGQTDAWLSRRRH
jgi:hypothetical protein